MRRVLMLFICVLVCLGLNVFPVSAHNELQGGRYFTLVNEKNHVIHKTALEVSTGDIYITADNSRYKVVEVAGSIARCVYQGQEKMPRIKEVKQTGGFNFFQHAIPVLKGKNKPTIAVYHTHDDESYVPTDGKESILGNGGIYDVGQSLVSELKKLGFNVQYSQAKHDPHDVNAYHRSRKTAASLLKKGPDAIIDVHRDAVPPDVYQTNVKGEKATKVKLVLGRQNPNMKTNLDFAKNLKAAMDKQTPGLSNGIYIGKGSYNQDLSPRAILIEVGSHTNSKKEAENGVALFARTLPGVFGLSSTAAQTDKTGAGAAPAKKPLTNNKQGASSMIWTILIVAAVIAGAYYFLNRNLRQK